MSMTNLDSKIRKFYNGKVFIIDYTGVNANIAQIQIMASIINDMVNNKFCIESRDLLYSIPLPSMYNTWESLYEYCQKHSNAIMFIIKSETLGSSKYICGKYDYKLPDSIIYLRLFALQNQFDKLNNLDFSDMKESEILELTDSLINTYMLLNNDIGNYFFNLFYDCQDFDFQLKFKPCCINLPWIRDLRGFGRFVIYELKKTVRKKFEMIFKVRMQEIACQCRYLSFWACLLQIISCTSLPKRVLASFEHFAFCLLKNVDSAFVHYIVVEQSPLNNNTNVLNRGSNDNTTRIKVYFTYEDGEPLVARFDLPHKGVPFLHLNIEDANGKTPSINHCKISITPDKENILKPLEESLMTFNYSGINIKHSTPDEDHSILHQVKLERALFGICPIIWSTILFTSNKEGNKDIYGWDGIHQEEVSKQAYDYINECRNVLKHEIESCGISEELSDFDLFDLIYSEKYPDMK